MLIVKLWVFQNIIPNIKLKMNTSTNVIKSYWKACIHVKTIDDNITAPSAHILFCNQAWKNHLKNNSSIIHTKGSKIKAHRGKVYINSHIWIES